MAITFAQAKEIVRAAEESTWTVGTCQIEDEASRTQPTGWWYAVQPKPD